MPNKQNQYQWQGHASRSQYPRSNPLGYSSNSLPQNFSQSPPPQNFSQGPSTPSAYQPPHLRNVEEVLYNLIQSQTAIDNQNGTTINDIRSQLTKRTNSIGASQLEKGKFPAQPQGNPRGQRVIDSSEPNSEICV